MPWLDQVLAKERETAQDQQVLRAVAVLQSGKTWARVDDSRALWGPVENPEGLGHGQDIAIGIDQAGRVWAISGGGGGGVGPPGPEGPQGPMGPAGPQGPIGNQGPKGDPGPQGAQGAPGAAGTPGAAGADGAPGAQGPQGIQGPAGAAGAQGPKGDKGDKGDTGAQGVPGVSPTVNAAAGRGAAGTNVDCGTVWRNLPIPTMTMDPAGAFTMVGGAVQIVDNGWYQVNVSVGHPAGDVVAFYVAISTVATPGDGDIANGASGSGLQYNRATAAGAGFLTAGTRVYVHGYSPQASPVNLNVMMFSITRVGGPTGPQGPAGTNGVNGAINTVQDEGVSLPVRSNINIVGPNITASDDAANDRITIRQLIPVVTTLPAGVFPDGYEVYLQNSTMAGFGVRWKFAYNATTASTLKWDFVGGAGWGKFGGSDATTSTAPVDLNPAVFMASPALGEYEVWFGCQCWGPTPQGYAYIDVNLAGSLALQSAVMVAQANAQINAGGYYPILQIAYNADVRVRFHVSGGANYNFGYRTLAIRPVRASA